MCIPGFLNKPPESESIENPLSNSSTGSDGAQKTDYGARGGLFIHVTNHPLVAEEIQQKT
ncbi:MAG: hypothetical protein LBJ69_00885 [Holosporales bacterium]|nr:hypothetical protein [Holosporales bacterium]